MKQVIFFTIVLGAITTQVNARGKRPDLALWLARSCVGEAGWNSADTGECAAIAWVYHKRSYNFPRRDYFKTMMEYSAAIKPDPRRPWIRRLTRRGDRPPLLETNIYWGKHQKKWFKVLEVADNFFRGRVTDPCPDCLHYGGHFDKKRMDLTIWRVAKTPDFNNLFFERR